MLSRKIRIVSIVILVLYCFSCIRDKRDDRNKKRSQYIQYSNRIIGKEKYYEIYNAINDSINIWKLHEVGSRSIWVFDYRLDSVICFNNEKNKLVSAFLVRCNREDCLQDDIHFFYGVKIKKKWFFFKGANITLPREMYQKDIHTPLSFEKLHEIAMREVFGGYLIKKKKDAGWWKNTFNPEYEYEINEAWFDSHFKNMGICSDCITDEDFEKIWKINALSQWKK